jgi:hypothetical protein
VGCCILGPEHARAHGHRGVRRIRAYFHARARRVFDSDVRLLQLAGRKDTLCHFPQLKTRSEWEDLDRTWALICEYNDWEHWPLEPVEPGKAQWLEIPTDDAFWTTCFREQMKASWESCERRTRPKKAKAHTYASRQILY